MVHPYLNILEFATWMKFSDAILLNVIAIANVLLFFFKLAAAWGDFNVVATGCIQDSYFFKGIHFNSLR